MKSGQKGKSGMHRQDLPRETQESMRGSERQTEDPTRGRQGDKLERALPHEKGREQRRERR